MADHSWDDQFKSFLKKTGDDLKRMGEDLRSEAQKLLDKAQDPDTQEKMRARAKEVGFWAKQAAADVADLVEKGAQKAEEAVRNIARPVEAAGAAPAKSPSKTTPAPRAAAATAKNSGGVSKTVGSKKRPEAGAPKKKPAAKKTIGRKPKT